jgi:hypothetical protein
MSDTTNPAGSPLVHIEQRQQPPVEQSDQTEFERFEQLTRELVSPRQDRENDDD